MDVTRVSGMSPEPGVDYFDIDREERLTLRDKARDIAKDVLRKFIDGRPGDRIGIVVFGADAFVASPITLDHEFLLQNLGRI